MARRQLRSRCRLSTKQGYVPRISAIRSSSSVRPGGDRSVSTTARQAVFGLKSSMMHKMRNRRPSASARHEVERASLDRALGHRHWGFAPMFALASAALRTVNPFAAGRASRSSPSLARFSRIVHLPLIPIASPLRGQFTSSGRAARCLPDASMPADAHVRSIPASAQACLCGSFSPSCASTAFFFEPRLQKFFPSISFSAPRSIICIGQHLLAISISAAHSAACVGNLHAAVLAPPVVDVASLTFIRHADPDADRPSLVFLQQ